MKFVTFGTRVMDDAIILSKNENKLRITRVSPFVLKGASCLRDHSMVLEKIEQESSYWSKMLSFQLSNDLRDLLFNLKTDFLCLDFLDVWRPMFEYVFLDNTKIRITQNEILEKYGNYIIEKLEECHGKVVTERLVEPLKWNDEQLEYEIKIFIDWLNSARSADSGQLLVLEAYMPFQKIQNDRITFWGDITEISSKNSLIEKCISLFKRNEKNCIIIPKVDVFVGNEKYSDNGWYNYCQEYYSYILDSIEAKFEQVKQEQISLAYMRKIQQRIDKAVFPDIIEQYQKKGKNRSVILFGSSEVLEEYPEFAKNVYAVIPYFYKMSYDIKFLECFEGKYEDYIFVFSHIFSKDDILKKLFKLGYCYPYDVITPHHDPIILSNFTGTYSDVYHNFVTIKKATTLYLQGNASVVSVGRSEMPNFQIHIAADEQAEVMLEDNIRPDKLSIGLNPGCRIFIGNGTTFADNCKIGMPIFSRVIIGRDCMFSSKVEINSGDGHNIYNLETNECINFTKDMVDTEKTTVKLGGHVWVGYEVVLLSGTDIGFGCVVGARAVVKDKYSNNSMIVGVPARAVKKDIGWAREPFVTDIFAESSNVDNDFLQKTVEGEI